MTDKMTALATKIDWSKLSDVILEGGYELKEVLDLRDNAAKLRVRILGSGGKTGVAYFMHLDPADAADQFDIWNTLREAPHANVNRPVAVGKREVAGFNTVYMVLADADEKLAAVVPERPLEWEEAAEVLHSCEKGLTHLHAHGLIHGSVSPWTVEAIGYSVLLNCESVRRLGKSLRIEWSKPQYFAPESKHGNLTTAADVWCLGATLFEVLAQEPYGTVGAELEKGLPLAAVIHRCLDRNPTTRCTLKEAPAVEQAVEQDQPVVAAAEPLPAAVQPETPVTARTQQPHASTPPSREARNVPPPFRPVDNRIPGQGTTTSRGAPAARLPHPLTPKFVPKQVTKDDMVLVPVAKRHKRVQKRQPVGARIRTLDAPENVFLMGEATTERSGPAVSARILAVGGRSALVRNTIAVIGLLLLVVAAVKFIIIPKLSSTDQPLTSGVTAQTDAGSVASPNVPAPGPAPVGGPAAVANQQPSQPAPASDQTAAGETTPPVPIPVKREFLRVVLSYFPSRPEAVRELDVISQQHPELILHVAVMKSDTGQEKYAVVVGGLLNRGEAEPLQQRLLAKGIKSALVRVEK